MEKFKLGDIILDTKAGKHNPLKVFVFFGEGYPNSNVLYIDEYGDIGRCGYYTRTLYSKEGRYVLVGRSTAFDDLKAELSTAKNNRELGVSPIPETSH